MLLRDRNAGDENGGYSFAADTTHPNHPRLPMSTLPVTSPFDLPERVNNASLITKKEETYDAEVFEEVLVKKSRGPQAPRSQHHS